MACRDEVGEWREDALLGEFGAQDLLVQKEEWSKALTSKAPIVTAHR